MFELFMIAVFSVAGMLLGNLIINCIVALSDSIESSFDENISSNNFRHRKKLLTNETVNNANQIIRDRKNLFTPAEIKALEIIKDKNIDINYGVKKACEVLKERGIFEK